MVSKLPTADDEPIKIRKWDVKYMQLRAWVHTKKGYLYLFNPSSIDKDLNIPEESNQSNSTRKRREQIKYNKVNDFWWKIAGFDKVITEFECGSHVFIYFLSDKDLPDLCSDQQLEQQQNGHQSPVQQQQSPVQQQQLPVQQQQPPVQQQQLQADVINSGGLDENNCEDDNQQKEIDDDNQQKEIDDDNSTINNLAKKTP